MSSAFDRFKQSGNVSDSSEGSGESRDDLTQRPGDDSDTSSGEDSDFKAEIDLNSESESDTESPASSKATPAISAPDSGTKAVSLKQQSSPGLQRKKVESAKRTPTVDGRKRKAEDGAKKPPVKRQAADPTKQKVKRPSAVSVNADVTSVKKSTSSPLKQGVVATSLVPGSTSAAKAAEAPRVNVDVDADADTSAGKTKSVLKTKAKAKAKAKTAADGSSGKSNVSAVDVGSEKTGQADKPAGFAEPISAKPDNSEDPGWKYAFSVVLTTGSEFRCTSSTLQKGVELVLRYHGVSMKSAKSLYVAEFMLYKVKDLTVSSDNEIKTGEVRRTQVEFTPARCIRVTLEHVLQSVLEI